MLPFHKDSIIIFFTWRDDKMRVKLPVPLFLISTIIISCHGNPISSKTNSATITSTPRKEPTSTITPSLTETPRPTSIRQPTISAFENLLMNVCPTTTPNPTQNTTSISDNDILREFAGGYSKSTGFWIYDLVLNCDGTFYEIIFTDTGDIFVYQGIAEVRDNLLLLNVTNLNKPLTFELIPLRWGQRRYLIYNDIEVESFCESLISDYGKEPRDKESIIGLFYLRIGDKKIEVEGFPILPNGKEICK